MLSFPSTLRATWSSSLAATYVVAVLLAGLSIYSLFFFLSSNIHWLGPDTPYYMSVAESYNRSGVLMNLTMSTAQPLRTPQNGIVPFFIALDRLGLSVDVRLITMTLIIFALHVSATYPLYKIARTVGMAGMLPMVALLAVHLGAFHIYRFQLLPYNDGIFNALSLWLTYLLLVAYQDLPAERPWQLSDLASNWRLLALLVGLSAVLVHFRLNSVLVIGAALLAAIAVGRYRHAILGLALLAVSLASISLAYGSVDTTVMSRVSGRVLDDIVAQFPSGVVDLATDRVPKLLFESTSGVVGLIYAPFALALGLALVRGYLKREHGVMFVGLSCVAALVFLAALPFGNQRMLLYIFPLMYLFVLMPGRLRVIGYLFAVLVVGSSLITFVTGFDKDPSQAFWLHVRQQGISLSSDDPLVLSQRTRFPYLFLGARAFRERLMWDKVVSRGGLFIIGDRKYVAERLERLERMARRARYSFQQRTLTPDYRDNPGHTILEIYELGTAPARRPAANR